MNLGKYIFGIREEYLEKVPLEEKSRQLRVYNILTLMLFFLTFLIFVSGIIYGLILLQSWFYALLTGLFLAIISFNLMLLALFLNLTTSYKELNNTMTDMEILFKEHSEEDLTQIEDINLKSKTQELKMQLRETNITPSFDRFHFSNIFKVFIKIILLLILSIFVSTALEIFFFKNNINNSIEYIQHSNILIETSTHQDSTINHRNLILKENAQWIIEMRESLNQEIDFIHCNSITFTLDVLYRSLGNYKILMDILISFLFLIPLFFVIKSKEFSGGQFLKESALNNIATSYYFNLISQKKKQQIHKEQDLKFKIDDE